MAEKVLQNSEDQLNCSICLDTYTNPKLLQCFHVYCKECLVHLLIQDQWGKLFLNCPTCQQATPVQDTEMSGLQSAFHIKHLPEIVEKKRTETTEVVATGAALEQQSSHCTEHVDEELKLYCETCSEVICYKCISKWGKHHSHDYESISKAFEKYKEEISTFLEPMGNQWTRIDQALTDLEKCSAEVSVQQNLVEANIEVTVRELYKVLETRKTKLLSRLQGISQCKRRSLAAQKNQLKNAQTKLHSCEDFVRQSIKTECQSEVLKMKKSIVHQAKELTTEFPPSFLKTCTEPDTTFSTPGDATAVLKQYGDVLSMSMVDPAKFHAMGSGLETAEKSTATYFESLECELELRAWARVRDDVKERERGKYEISNQPARKGRHLRSNIRRNQFDVGVVSPVEGLGAPFGGFEYPQGVAFNHAGEIVISAGDSVSVLSPNGTKLISFGTRGSGPGHFHYPRGVAVDDEGNILVADCNNHRIQKFTKGGQFLASVGTKGTGPLHFHNPRDVAFKKKVYVVDNENHCIQVLKSDLTFSKIIGEKHGSQNGKFAFPCGVTCDSTGNVYVADSGNHRIQVFTASMKFLRKFGRRGKGEGELDWPVGVAVDSRGMLFISERNNHRISMFTTEGQFVKSFGQYGTKPGEFKYPMLLAVNANGMLCVCDRDNGRVQVYIFTVFISPFSTHQIFS